ncbi:DMT family transporter [Lacibacter luteus]|uniref:DMT family transporter n=1 Tax=Lacibacter luteus TaxID=2508719 RepID=A0A4V1M743_9BACT|nr:DMT family transporter [Lacibacter luteus]RXK58155.1 DMT family transporter [Lacibacter luteus]
MKHGDQPNLSLGILLAVAATIIWSGNFVVARSVIHSIPPVTLAFYRWATAVIILTPVAWKHIKPAWQIVKENKAYFFWTGLTGVSLFNTFVYIAGHSSTAINLALIGTTSSPIMSVILAAWFLKEPVSWRRLLGMLLCIAGILFLLSKGSFQNLLHLQFNKGDAWVLLGALSFAVYNIFARKRPQAISALGFLFFVFLMGAVLLFPAYIAEAAYAARVQWSMQTVLVILYLGLGASVISFLFWNRSIKELGAGRTSLFGNLIPIFSTMEAIAILGEKINYIHIVSFLLIVAGLIVDNSVLLKRK